MDDPTVSEAKRSILWLISYTSSLFFMTPFYNIHTRGTSLFSVRVTKVVPVRHILLHELHPDFMHQTKIVFLSFFFTFYLTSSCLWKNEANRSSVYTKSFKRGISSLRHVVLEITCHILAAPRRVVEWYNRFIRAIQNERQPQECRHIRHFLCCLTHPTYQEKKRYSIKN